MFQWILGGALLAALLMGVQDWHNHHGGREPFSPITMPQAPAPSRAPQAAAEKPIVIMNAQKAVTKDELALAHEDAMRIVRTAKAYGVPEGAPFAIVMMETRFIHEESGTNPKRWLLARDLALPGSKCSEHYGAEACAMRFERLKAICTKQARPICDPNTVRVTYGMAMGVAQQMPQWLWLAGPGNTLVWSEHAKDADGDGVINPLDLDDALAITASQLRKNHDKAVAKGVSNPWREAVIMYAGRGPDNLPKPQYYDGHVKDGKRIAGAVDYWKAWQQCRAQGDCPAMIARLRAR